MTRYCPQTPIVLVGTKLDVREGESTVLGSNGPNIGSQVVGHIECSSYTGVGASTVHFVSNYDISMAQC